MLRAAEAMKWKATVTAVFLDAESVAKHIEDIDTSALVEGLKK
jgi:hypothetical protein